MTGCSYAVLTYPAHHKHVYIYTVHIAIYTYLHMYTSPHRAKHPTKVHVWAGISLRGRSGICIFDGMMDRFLYVDILGSTLMPFMHEVFPNGHRFMQDNDPKHTSKYGKAFLETNNIQWMKTPAESPDLNPVENSWHELKEFLWHEIKPKVKEELVEGIVTFWNTVDVPKCNKYIRHMCKVIPRVIELQGMLQGISSYHW